ncbi:hypothetical protein HAX54_003824, partial [Datura stramonium]|nr:hypothetical protein [Datura stramonium]
PHTTRSISFSFHLHLNRHCHHLDGRHLRSTPTPTLENDWISLHHLTNSSLYSPLSFQKPPAAD